MAEQRKRWAELVAARVTGTPPPVEEALTEPVGPAWARALADRAAGRTPDPETVREAHTARSKPRSTWEKTLLARLGQDEDDGPPDAA